MLLYIINISLKSVWIVVNIITSPDIAVKDIKPQNHYTCIHLTYPALIVIVRAKQQAYIHRYVYEQICKYKDLYIAVLCTYVCTLILILKLKNSFQ